METALVLPFPKVDNCTELKDFRPLSILPALSKLIEKIIAEQFKPYLYQNSIIPQFESGFRPMHTTQTALLQIVDEITLVMDNKQVTIIIFHDQSKAFDVVNFDVLIVKLKYMGCDNIALTWLNQKWRPTREYFRSYSFLCIHFRFPSVSKILQISFVCRILTGIHFVSN